MGSENRGGGPKPHEEEEDFGLSEILPQYFDLCRRDLLHLKAALSENDFERVRVLGHNLKGSGGAYGFPVLTEIGESLETSGKSQDKLLAKSATERLAEFLDRHQHK
jgi:HPt (histidine-containing phosphotransfer) domain-containing protein